MPRRLLALVALAALPAPFALAEDPKAEEALALWTPEELKSIDRGLEAINCDRKDLGFHKRPIDDPFRLKVVDRALDDPLSIGSEVRTWDDAARTADPENVIARSARALGVALLTDLEDPDDVPDDLRLPVGISWFLDRLSRSNDLLDSAMGEDTKALLRKAYSTQMKKPQEEVEGPELTDEAFLAAVQPRDLGLLLSVAGRVLRDLRRVLPSFLEAARSAKEIPAGLAGVTPAGRVVFTGSGDDVHEEDDALLVIDFGGNDTWTRGASARGTRLLSVRIDLAGDDRYVGQKDLSFGGALGGVAIQWDCGGNDLYDAGHASLGAGILGVGILVDEAGDDVYRSKDFGQGAGAFGVGILLDKAGNDLRHVDFYGQGFASVRGCGVLADLAGNDVYDAGGVHSDAPLHRDRTMSFSQGFAIGMRPHASGGVGVLVDVSGNDRYSCDVYGQGASYWYSLGLLVDDDGNDTYVCGHYGQGAGIHLSAGMLLDRAGQDLYYTEYGVGVGGAHDLAVGFLVDRGGDDHYAGSGGSQGGALTNSVAMLLDTGGDDGYTAVRIGASHGAATPARDTGGIGLFLDSAGKDVYSEVTRDGGTWTSGVYGVGLDEPTASDAPPPPDPMGAEITKEQAKAKVDAEGTVEGADGKRQDDLDALWKIAIRWQVGDERMIGPIARERLVALGERTLDRAIERLGSQDGLELEAVQAMLQAFPKEKVVPRLVEASRSRDVATRRSAARFLGTLGAAEAVGRLSEMLSDDDARLQALRSLASLKKAPPGVDAFLRSPKELEGVATAACLAVADPPAIDVLVGALGPDVPYLARIAAEQRLAALGEPAVPALSRASKEAPTVRARRSAIRALGGTKSAGAIPALVAALTNLDPWVRFTAREAAARLAKDLSPDAAKPLLDAIEQSKKAEADSVVRSLR